MQPRPPELARRNPRRNRTRQRERMYDWLAATDSHPTANQIFSALRPEFPNLSLGTVYRNLEVLIGDGLVTELACSGGPSRFDGNPNPHHHFICDDCGRVVDIELSEPRGMAKRLERDYGMRARRISIDFHGSCLDCEG